MFNTKPETISGGLAITGLIAIVAAMIALFTWGLEFYAIRAACGLWCVFSGSRLLTRPRGILTSHMEAVDRALAKRDPWGESWQWTALGVFYVLTGVWLILSWWLPGPWWSLPSRE